MAKATNKESAKDHKDKDQKAAPAGKNSKKDSGKNSKMNSGKDARKDPKSPALVPLSRFRIKNVSSMVPSPKSTDTILAWEKPKPKSLKLKNIITEKRGETAIRKKSSKSQ